MPVRVPRARAHRCTLWECDQDSHGRPVTRRRIVRTPRFPPSRPCLYKTRRALGSCRHSNDPYRNANTRAPSVRLRNATITFRYCYQLVYLLPSRSPSARDIYSSSSCYSRVVIINMRPVAELRPSYRVQMHMMQQRQQHHPHNQQQLGSEYDEQPVSRTYQYRKVIRILIFAK